VEVAKPDVPDELPTPGGDGATEEIGTKKAELPESMAA
jgi:tRNA-dihydrouridine synthase B